MDYSSIPINLKRIRIARGLNQSQAAALADISRVAYFNIESGKALPRASNLEKLARGFGVKVQDVLAAPAQCSSIRFRSSKIKTEKSKIMREQVINEVTRWKKCYDDLEILLDQQRSFSLSNININDNSLSIKELAWKTREMMGLELDEIVNDICGLVESAGIKIKLIDSNMKDFFGLSIIDDASPAIAINIGNLENHISIERQIFTVAHELGHLVLHKNSFKSNEIDELEDQEKEADIFASYFLMPEERFKKVLKENSGLYWVDNILHIKRLFKVSYKTVIYRLIESGHSSQELWQKFGWLYSKKYGSLKNHEEPCPLQKFDFIEDRLNNLVRNALEQSIISVSRAAEILNLKLSEMRDLINSWAIVDEEKSC
jgi:Zn-dependent peptidase ImmA (M78 family)/DNA-binding XRE family transcriptional regulator